MKLYQTITVSDNENPNGFITVEYQKEAYFWLRALCSKMHNGAYCIRTEGDNTYVFPRGSILELRSHLDKYMRKKEVVRFPSSEYMRKFSNFTARAKEDINLFDEISAELTWLAPFALFTRYIDSDKGKAITIKFEEVEV